MDSIKRHILVGDSLIYYISLVGVCLTHASPKRPAITLVFLNL